jgi:hypothetical protein
MPASHRVRDPVFFTPIADAYLQNLKILKNTRWGKVIEFYGTNDHQLSGLNLDPRQGWVLG